MLPRAIDVLTINVWGLPWPFARDRARRYARIAKHFHLSDYHLVGVQEAWWVGGTLAIPGLRLGPGRGDSGLGLGGSLSGDGPTELLAFQRAAGLDRLASKGLLLARFGGLTVGVTHLQAGAEATIRAHQTAQIVERLAAERGPVVLMGDFNFATGLDAASEDRLGVAGFVDTAEAVPAPTFVRRNPFAARQGPERYDRIYVRDGVDQRWTVDRVRVLSRIWSDHQPVHAALRLG